MRENLIYHHLMSDTFVIDINEGYGKEKLFYKILRLPEVDGYKYLWVVIYRMTKMVHLVLLMKMTTTKLSWIYLRYIWRL